MKRGKALLAIFSAGLLLTACGNPSEKGVEYLEKGEYDQAVEQFEQAIEKNKNTGDAWRGIGYVMTIFLAGLNTIPQTYYEAAKIDGAGVKETFWEITIPLLKPTTYFVTLVTAISSFQIFDLIYVMTSGGPANSTNVIVYSIYKYAFEYFDIGKSCALAYILFGIIFVLALAQKQFRNN